MRFVSLQSKDVINVYDGKKIGYIADIELDWCQKCIRALIVEKMNFFHFLMLLFLIIIFSYHNSIKLPINILI